VVTLVVINYMLPIMAFTAVEGDWKSYENGCYVGIASKYGGKIFGSCIALGQCVSTTGLFENGLVKNSYTLAGMAEQTLLPAIFKYRWVRNSPPHFRGVVKGERVRHARMTARSFFQGVGRATRRGKPHA